MLTLPLTAVIRNNSPKVTVSWELGMGSCTTTLPPAADPLAQTEGNTTSGESLGPSPTSAQPLLIQSSTSSLYTLTSTARAQLPGTPQDLSSIRLTAPAPLPKHTAQAEGPTS